MRVCKGLALSALMLLFLSCLASAQIEANWNMTEKQVDSAMVQKGFSFINSSWKNGRFMKLYSGYTQVFGIQFDGVAYSWQRSNMPDGSIEAIMFTHRVTGLSDPSVTTVRDLLVIKYGYPNCDETLLTCEWRNAGRVAALLQFSGSQMNLYLVNPKAIGW